ncbi:MAG: CbiX/SirB N-terminal domain-containing protein [Elusimicrobiota bacterium]|nr:CbiX/SirB N-terminal domain-containing protein [Elusimicrobiota bacterium]
MTALALALSLAAAAAGPAAPAAPSYGILLLAHGGDPSWNAEVEALRARVDASVPVETALGMADAAAIKAASERLRARGAAKIVAVPLFVHSRSEVMDQTRFVLGLAEKPSEVLREGLARMAKAHAAHAARGHAARGHAAPGGHHAHAFSTERAVPPVPTVLTAALDDDPLVSGILLARAKALSRDPKTETVVLVAHGPVDPAALPAWEKDLAAHAARLKADGGFRAVHGLTLRDDAAPVVRAAAVARLRAAVKAGASGGRTLVVPALLARGGIEAKIPKELAGLDYAWDGRTLMPDAGFEAWLAGRGRVGAEAADMRLPQAAAR